MTLFNEVVDLLNILFAFKEPSIKPIVILLPMILNPWWLIVLDSLRVLFKLLFFVWNFFWLLKPTKLFELIFILLLILLNERSLYKLFLDELVLELILKFPTWKILSNLNSFTVLILTCFFMLKLACFDLDRFKPLPCMNQITNW